MSEGKDNLEGLNIPNVQPIPPTDLSAPQAEEAQKQENVGQNIAEEQNTPLSTQNEQAVQPQSAQNLTNLASQPAPTKKNKTSNLNNKRTLMMIFSIIFTIIAIILSIVTVLKFFDIYSSGTGDAKLNGILTFLGFLLWYGWFTYLPALVCAILGIIFSALGLKTSSVGAKVTCGFMLTFSIITTVFLIAIFFLAGILI